MSCLDEDLITDLAAGRLRLDGAGVEEHLAACPACASILGSAVADFDRRTAPATVDDGQTTHRARRAPPSSPSGRGALEPGSMLKGTYAVKRLIGSGGMGEVYEVEHVRLAGRYAVKVLRREISNDEELVVRFRREAEITSALRHPHIVQVIDFDRTEDGCFFLAMEFLEGTDLATLLHREGRLLLPRVLKLVGQVTMALAAAHRRGIVHRDLKPANVFVLEDDDSAGERLKLMDFGLSKFTEASLNLSLSLSRDQALIGTPRYMAPEQARGKNRQVTPATDQFALAAIIHEMLAGEAPFAGETLGEILHAILYEPPIDLRGLRPDLPPAVAATLLRALAKEPEKRFPSIQDFCRALEEAASSPPAGPPAPRRRTRRVVLGVLTAAGVLGLVLAALSFQRSGARTLPGPAPERAATVRAAAPPSPPAEQLPPRVQVDAGLPATAAANLPAAPSRKLGSQPQRRKPRPAIRSASPADPTDQPAPAAIEAAAVTAAEASPGPAPEPVPLAETTPLPPSPATLSADAGSPPGPPRPRRDDLIERL